MFIESDGVIRKIRVDSQPHPTTLMLDGKTVLLNQNDHSVVMGLDDWESLCRFVHVMVHHEPVEDRS